MLEQQSRLALQRTRRLFIRQQIAIINSIRAHLGEFGIGGPVGRHGVEKLIADSMTPGSPKWHARASPLSESSRGS